MLVLSDEVSNKTEISQGILIIGDNDGSNCNCHLNIIILTV